MAARELTVAEHIFKDVWLVQVPEMYLYSKEYLEVAGYPSSGDKDIDREMLRANRDMYLTIAGITLLHDEGARIIFKNPEDTGKIYKLLREHLENWKWVVDTQLNGVNPPVDDLRKMDALAAAIYPIASRYINTKAPVSGIFARFAELAESRGKVMSKGIVQPRIEQNQSNAPAEEQAVAAQNIHAPIADAIARKSFIRR